MTEREDYTKKHQKILDILSDPEWFVCDVAQLARAVVMDPRTVRGHLEVMEMDKAGAFLGADNSLFTTKAGIIALAQKLGMRLASTRTRGKAKRRRIGIDRSSPRRFARLSMRRGGP